ncbi:conserved hypothetical protein [Cytophaga hutchinsonii ATCC 33406]|uniref:DUF5777 domain-containing protein n=2 Tax=Cytophaga hutchinsonii TaxID=985 RepID=A0A6N4SMY8_CYTH3|nr:conserved hypothetical protein [Cytophaga hutchinsonii ATCC 33406]SFX01755.1 hypothetical protein SAMN04487930_101200 [Cytophaga hutchinsonii ATCC 33406]
MFKLIVFLMLKNNYLFSGCLFLLMQLGVFAQSDLDSFLIADAKPAKVIASFKATRIVNAHSIETVRKGILDFRITHHFGDVAGNSGGVHTLYGFDNASDIRFGFEYGITDRLTAGFGRSKVAENLDFFLKYRLLQQTQDNSMPVSVTLFADMVLTPQENASAYAKFENRMSYVYELLIARKFNERFTLQVMPLFLHRNYAANPNDHNDVFSLGVGGRLKLTKRFAIIADYYYTFSDYLTTTNSFYAPMGVGVEIETGGHVFQMFVTNNAGIIENNYIANTRSSWGKGEFKIGFTISRDFAFNKKKKKTE